MMTVISIICHRFLMYTKPDCSSDFFLQISKIMVFGAKTDVLGYAYAFTVTIGGAIGYIKAGEFNRHR